MRNTLGFLCIEPLKLLFESEWKECLLLKWSIEVYATVAALSSGLLTVSGRKRGSMKANCLMRVEMLNPVSSSSLESGGGGIRDQGRENSCTKRRRVLKSKFMNLERSSVSIKAEMPSVISFHTLDQRCLAASLTINLCKRIYQAAFSRARKSNWDLCWESATPYSSDCWDNLNHATWKTPGEELTKSARDRSRRIQVLKNFCDCGILTGLKNL